MWALSRLETVSFPSELGTEILTNICWSFSPTGQKKVSPSVFAVKRAIVKSNESQRREVEVGWPGNTGFTWLLSLPLIPLGFFPSTQKFKFRKYTSSPFIWLFLWQVCSWQPSPGHSQAESEEMREGNAQIGRVEQSSDSEAALIPCLELGQKVHS